MVYPISAIDNPTAFIRGQAVEHACARESVGGQCPGSVRWHGASAAGSGVAGR